MMNTKKWCFLCIILFAGLSSCKKSSDLKVDPYAGGKEPLGIRFSNALPKPASGISGADVVYQITGLLPYKDKIKCYLNETEATVTEITDKTIKLKVPEGASSGGVTIVIDGQIFFGPEFTVTGKAGIDPTFKTVIGTNGIINQIMPLNNGNMMLIGSFTDYEKSTSKKVPISGIVLTSPDGQYIPTAAFGAGAGGSLTSMVKLTNGQYMVGGAFSTFNKRKSIGNITRLNANGSLDSTIVEVVNLTPLQPKNSFDTVAAFNGALMGQVSKVFSYNNKVIVVGGFNSYYEHFYERSTRDTKVLGFIRMESLLRMEASGGLDSTYNYNKATKSSYERPNGFFYDAIMQSDGKVIVVGSFTKFQGKAANYIARVDNNGIIDPGFQVGAGADGLISSIRYNATTGKYLLCGSFKTFNGKPANGVVMMNSNGTVDESFSLGKLEGGSIGFAAQLSDGKILVSGSFNKYNNVIRQGFMILNANGTLAEGYNNTGMFQGVVSDIYETTSPLGFPAVVIVGYISKFDNKAAGNIVRLVLRP
ncbi:MAG: DUF5008 domain-containing protein [Candidatus Pedobacter colombiensis]|uniref:DUF5008 domain-containing protein n=1 Tax=Candidatus Pedobacter colombiensis TaxID=3121371 RepID=A0AAJ6B753_9SPHI|nr:DUF5008 domain-containing protein [Pedobacter sp.]WEK19549.1 MAG: DUF5008 domain-containing protein [Pedobacter sp.]